MVFPIRLGALVLLPLLSSNSAAQSVIAGPLTLGAPWARQTAPTQKSGGGYLTIRNGGSSSDRLLAATSPISKRVELHTMAVEKGVMRMRPVPGGIPVPAGKLVELKPGGLHLMFVDLKRPLQIGETFPVTLRFERQGRVTVKVRVRAVGAAMPMEASHAE